MPMSRPEAIRVLLELGLQYGIPSAVDVSKSSPEAIGQLLKEGAGKRRK